MTAPHDGSLAAVADEPDVSDEIGIELTLFVSGAAELSAQAIADARRLCDVHLPAGCRLSVVDVHDDPAAVEANRVVATPTLVKHRPPPVRKVVGDLSDTDKVLRALQLAIARDAFSPPE